MKRRDIVKLDHAAVNINHHNISLSCGSSAVSVVIVI